MFLKMQVYVVRVISSVGTLKERKIVMRNGMENEN